MKRVNISVVLLFTKLLYKLHKKSVGNSVGMVLGFVTRAKVVKYRAKYRGWKFHSYKIYIKMDMNIRGYFSRKKIFISFGC